MVWVVVGACRFAQRHLHNAVFVMIVFVCCFDQTCPKSGLPIRAQESGDDKGCGGLADVEPDSVSPGPLVHHLATPEELLGNSEVPPGALQRRRGPKLVVSGARILAWSISLLVDNCTLRTPMVA